MRIGIALASRWPPRRGPTLPIVACNQAFDEPVDGVWASDHFGVVAELAVPAPR